MKTSKPFELNLKMIYNDTAQMKQRIQRMWSCAESDDDFIVLETLWVQLDSIVNILRKSLDIS